jgi:ankyrin repeat protein
VHPGAFDGTLAREGKEEAIRLVNLQTTQCGETALHQAARLGNCDSIALLLDLGATDMKDREGYNAFQ